MKWFRLFTAMLMAAISLQTFAASSLEGQFKQIVVFGDSFSDNGNTFINSTRTYPGGVYDNGRFSNGSTWSEYFAKAMDIDPAGANFRNYAYGQAQIDGEVMLTTHLRKHPEIEWQFSVPDLRGEITAYMQDGRGQDFISESLFIIFIGTNDLMNFTPAGDKDMNVRFIEGRFARLVDSVNFLKQQGAKKVVIFNMRDLMRTPLAKQLSAQYNNEHPKLASDFYTHEMQNLIDRFNAMLNKQFNTKEDDSVIVYDANAFDVQWLDRIEKSNTSGDYGDNHYQWHGHDVVMRSDEECYINQGNYVDVVGNVCESAEAYFYFDRIHPTTSVHYLMAQDVKHFLEMR